MTATELITKFYSAFSLRDWQTMNSCYSEDIVFSDPAFGILRGDEVRAMWEMLCKGAKDLEITYHDIRSVDDEYHTCQWTAKYTFSATGHKVINHIKAFMRIREGMIIEHSDAFKLSKWAAQALGWKGKLLGWSGFFKSGIQKKARKRLAGFITAREEAASG